MESTAAIHVPFRCPDCGDSVKFESLKDLRLHLQTDHADLTVNYRKKPSQFIPGLFASNNRSATPILDMYHADAVRIEDDLLMHKRNELNNKQRRMKSLSPNRTSNGTGVNNSRSTIGQLDRRTNENPTSFRQCGHSSRVTHKHFDKPSRAADREVKFNQHSFNSSTSNKYYQDAEFKDDESLNDATRPDINITRNTSRPIERIHNVSSSDTAGKNTRSSNVPKPVKIPESVSSDMDNHVRETLTTLSQEVVLTRANQQAAVDSLLASQEIYSCLEHSAQDKMCKQQEIIARLALKLSEKDEKLADLTIQVNSLRNQTTEEEIKNEWRVKSNQESEKMLQEELLYKQKELASLTQRMESVKQAVLKSEIEKKNINERSNLNDKDFNQKPEREIKEKPIEDDESEEDDKTPGKHPVSYPVNQARLVERDMQAKEKELVSLRSKSMQLESDRQTLLLEMQALLEIAANDNDKLRSELANQGKQLSKLNLELERSKQEQSELLGETNTLYYQADFSLSRLKHVLEERDSQLSSVSAQLEQAKEMQGKLAREREDYLKVAVDKEASYQVLVQENALQLKLMKESLARSQLEKEGLQGSLKDFKKELLRKEKEDEQAEGRMRDLEAQLADQEAWQVTMREQIKNKEERLHNAKKSMAQMNNFMSDTAQKELEARSRLEQFISNLIDRSTQTETELKKLRDAYEDKEKAFKDLIEAQQEQLNSKDSRNMTDGRMAQSYPVSWQRETQADIQSLSSYPSPISARRLDRLSNINAAKQPQHQPSPPYSQHSHPMPNYADEEFDVEHVEPTRMRSTIHQVKNSDNVDEASDRQQLKNRPILVLGKEYPHPSAYGAKKSMSRSTNDITNPSVEELENDYLDNRDSGRQNRGSLYGSKLYLPIERDDYALNASEPRRSAHSKSAKNPSHKNSSSSNLHQQMVRNKDTSPYRLNNSPLFKNTPEVEKMYQNVQKHTYAPNPTNLSKKNSLSLDQLNSSRSQRPPHHQLPMDDQGIIWGSNERMGLRARAQRKKVKRKTNGKSNKKDNLNNRNSDSEDLKEPLDSDEEAPPTQKRNGRSKSSAVSSPAPLGDKIAHLLNSVGPGTVASNARKEYEGHSTAATSRPYNERDTNLSYSASESDSQHSNPIDDARAVRERVAKLTARQQSYLDGNAQRAWSPTPKPRNTVDLDGQDRRKINNIPSPNNGLASDRFSPLSRYTNNPTTGEEYGIKENSMNSNNTRDSYDKKYGSEFNTRQIPSEERIFAENSYNVLSMQDKPMTRDTKFDESNRPYVEVSNVQDMYPLSPQAHIDDVHNTGYQQSLLHPYTPDLSGQLESQNAESEFSSSSYATMYHPGAAAHQADGTDYYPSDTLDEGDGVQEDVKPPNARDILAEVHRELRSRGSVDAAIQEDKDDDDEKYEHRTPSSFRDVRAQFQKSPMDSRESYFSRSSDSNRTSFQRKDSLPKSNSYDSVMKELLEKHPYINRASQEQGEIMMSADAGDVATESESSDNFVDENVYQQHNNEPVRDYENVLDENVDQQHLEIIREYVDPTRSRIEEYDASETDYVDLNQSHVEEFDASENDYVDPNQSHVEEFDASETDYVDQNQSHVEEFDASENDYVDPNQSHVEELDASEADYVDQNQSRIEEYDASEHDYVDPNQSRVEEYDASENDVLSSDDQDGNRVMRRQGSQGTLSRSTSRADTMDASTDTDLEKLATPGAHSKSLLGERKKKKKDGSLAKKGKNKKQKSAPKLKDMVKGSWTSVDVDDSEEAEREERLVRRRVRVALFCALAYADTRTLLAASQVCRDWRKIAHHPSLWKRIELKDAQISSQFLITLSQWCTQAEALTLEGLTGRSQKLMESEDDYGRSLRGSLEPGLERFLFGCQGTLKSLVIQGCENILTDKCMWMVSSNCRMLTHLTYRSHSDPVHPQVMWALGGGCPGITSLFVHPYPDNDSASKNAMNNRCLLQIGQFYRDLKEVGLGGMEFNMAGLVPFIQSCQHLTSVHMDSCQALTDDLATALCRAGLKDLRAFTITGTAFQAKAITTLHANCRHLKKIHATVTPQSCGLDLQKRKEKNEYAKLINAYKDLKKKAGLSHILTLDIEEVA